jgi:hypothetical protein
MKERINESKLDFQAANVAAEWVTLLIRKVPGSNLSPATGYPD